MGKNNTYMAADENSAVDYSLMFVSKVLGPAIPSSLPNSMGHKAWDRGI